MAIKNEKYTIQNHTHSQAAVLSVAETQLILQNYKYLNFLDSSVSVNNYLNPKFIRFDDVQDTDYGEFKSFVERLAELVDYDETTRKGFLFTNSNNLFEDVQFIEYQILMERYRRMSSMKDLLASRASVDNAGLVQLKENGGLTVDQTTKALQVDFSGIQPTLESEKNIKSIGDTLPLVSGFSNVSLLVGENQSDNVVKFKTINNTSLIYHGIDSENTDFQLATKEELEREIAKLVGTGTGITFAQFLETQNKFDDELNDFKQTVSAIQSQVVNILADMQNQDIGIGGGGTVGCVIANNNSPSNTTCDDLVLQASKAYYIKIVDKPFSSCSSGDGDWFLIDASSVTPTSEFDRKTLKFIFELRVNIDDSWINTSDSQKNWKFPWTWSRGEYKQTMIGEEIKDNSVSGGSRRLVPRDFGFTGFCFPKHTVSLIEITGIWKCNCWNFFGKVIDQYYINCDDSSNSQLI